MLIIYEYTVYIYYDITVNQIDEYAVHIETQIVSISDLQEVNPGQMGWTPSTCCSLAKSPSQ